MSLMWKFQRPAKAGWYWVRHKDGHAACVEVKNWRGFLSVMQSRDFPMTHIADGLFVAWAGPIAQPKEPTAQQLARVRFQLDGANLAPSTGGWGSYDWETVPRAEMLRRAKVRLCGGEDWQGKPWPADSQWVNLFTSVKRNGRWVRQNGERFTAATIDAAIAKEATVKAHA